MMPQANENLRVSVTKRNNESHRKRKKEVVEKNPIRMSWSQRGHDVYVILWKTADILRLEDVEILLSDTTCTITSPNCDELGWNLFLEVDSSKSQRVQAKNTILIIIPKKDPTVFWTSLKKTKSMSPKFSIDPPPHKVFLESPEEDAHSKVFKVPSLQTAKNSPTNTMATGTVVSLGILKGGNRPLSHCGSATDEMHTIDNVEVQKSSSNTSQDVTEIKGLLHKFDSTVGSSLKIPPKDYVTVEVHLRQDEITDLKIQFYQMTVSVQFQSINSDFCQKYKVSEKSSLVWRKKLSFSIIPEKCTYEITPNLVYLKLKKKETHPSEVHPHKNTNVHVMAPHSMQTLQSKPAVRLGYTGLSNLGNTCFMNSVIQALANTPQLQQYFLDEKFNQHINTKNPLGVGGRMAKAFYVVVRRLWDGSKQAFSPHEFKDVVGLKDSRFTDGMQHDAQEFMAFLLDMLHEDLNTATGPHTAEQPRKCEEESEEKMATDAWRSHVSRAGSFIVENFHGMLQSELECLKCKTKSIKFDPFLFLPVPLPKKVQPFTVIFFKNNPSPPIKITVPVLTDGPKAIEMLTQVARHTGTCINNLLSYEVSNCTIQRFFIPSSPLDCSSKTSTVHVQEVMSHEEIGEPVFQIICKQWKSVPDIRQQCVMCNRKPDDTFELKRCMNCLAVAYCNRNCQKDHWLKHRVVCRRRLQLVGQPFVMCITESSATFSNVKALAFEWSKLTTEFQITSSAEDVSGADEQISEIPFELKLSGWKDIGTENYPVLEDKGDTPLNFLKDLFISIVWQNKKSIAKSVTVLNKPLDFSQPSRCVDLMEKSSKHDLHKCLDLFIEPEVLSQDEAWYCPKCKKHMQAVKKMSLWDLPDVLIVQLKRFSFKNYLWRDKISMFIDMPVKNLDMSTYCNNPRKTKSMSYDLFAVINHHGGILGGHYTTDVRLPDIQDTTSSIVDWRTCDDSRVTKLNRKIVTEAAYVMFYLRRSSKSTPSCTNIPQHIKSDSVTVASDQAAAASSELNNATTVNTEQDSIPPSDRDESINPSAKNQQRSKIKDVSRSDQNSMKEENPAKKGDKMFSPLSPVSSSAEKLSKMHLDKVNSQTELVDDSMEISKQEISDKVTSGSPSDSEISDVAEKSAGETLKLPYTDMDAID